MGSTAVAPITPVNPASLFELEEDLQALLDTEALVPPEQVAEFRRELGAALKASISKRDRVAQFIRFCEMQQANCDDEITRLQARKRTFMVAENRVREYVVNVIESLGTDAKGKFSKLEGDLATFSLRTNPVSVEFEDERRVPPRWKTISLRMSWNQWISIVCSLANYEPSLLADLRQVADAATLNTAKPPIKKAIEAGHTVPGADLKMGEHSLVVK